ncbi:MAG: FAD-dependent monooxygenase [Kiritimatiellia bacterium]
MRIRVQQVKVPLQYDETRVARETALLAGCPPSHLTQVTLVRRSLDARPRNPEPLYVLTVEAVLQQAALSPAAVRAGVEVMPDVEPAQTPLSVPVRLGEPRPIVVGAGPSGLMAAHGLALAGARPILIERGDEAENRAARAARFWQTDELDPESNVLFGEGGAGLFSDGKLTARSKERGRVHAFMSLLHACGADESVLIDSEPHVGSDVLLRLLPNLRRRIVEAGGEVRFRARLDRLVVENGRLRAVLINGVETPCSRCVLAVGHSARDVYSLLAEGGTALTPRPFAVGLRLELPQAAIDRAQFGRRAGKPPLSSASFRLTRKEEHGSRPCYTFCMCPGGTVISCASEPGFFTTNGMSYSKRRLPWGNAAFLVPVGPDDYAAHPQPALAGVVFQRELEKRAFEAAGRTYRLPAARLADFLAGRASSDLPENRSCSRALAADLHGLLPPCVTATLETAIPAMLRELNGVNLEDALLYAPETRSSSPVRIERKDDGESVNVGGLFPAGEGAGYAGGIVSSAIDGIRAAEAVIQSLQERPL